jgi:type II secretory pathway component PulF
MPAFAVSAIDRHGVRRSLREDAPDEPRLRKKLRAQTLWPVRVREVAPDRKLARHTLPTEDFIALLQQLELQVRAGITADVALGELAADLPAGKARAMVEHIHREVSQGRAIHAACRFFERQFPPHLAAIIAAGEASAQLPVALRALIDHLQNVERLRRTARRAFIYPVIVLTATTALIVFLVGGVVPQFAAIFESLHLTLPAPTVLLIGISKLVRGGWLFALGAGASLGGTWLLLARSSRGKLFRDAVLLRAPLLGDTIRHLATARFAAHARLLHDAGIPLLDALTTGAELTANVRLARDVLAAREGVAQGKALYASLPARHAFPRFVVPALKSGETSGQLSEALKQIEAFAAGRAQERLATLLALLEPALIAVLTTVVGFIALSFFLPLFQLLGGIR